MTQQHEQPYNLQKAVTAAVTQQSIQADYKARPAGPSRNDETDFALTKQQKKVVALLAKCGWAKRYVNIVVQLGSQCQWKPYYRGEPVNEPYLQAIIDSIQPGKGSQQKMRAKALRLQTQIGTFGLTFEQAVGRKAYNVVHPNAVSKSRRRDHVTITGSAHNRDKQRDLHQRQIRRFWVPDDEYDNDPYSDLVAVIDEMERYCCALESIDDYTKQTRIFNNLLHLKLDNTEKNPFWSNPNNYNPESGKLQIEESLNDLNTQTTKAWQGNQKARYAPYPFIWPGEVNHKKLNDPVTVEMVQAAAAIAKQGAISLPIPTPFLSGEEGLANHWGDAENHRQLKDQTITPKLDDHDQFFNDYAFLPLLKAKRANPNTAALFKKYSERHLEMRSDTTCIDTKPDKSQLVFDLYQQGVATRAQAAEAAGIPSIMPLPADTTEYDHWLQVKGNPKPQTTTDPTARPEFPTQQASIASQAIALLR